MASDYDKPMIAGERDIFETYFDDPKFSDLTLKLSDRTVHVHRVVLCRGSKYFKSLLAGSFQESEAKQVELHEDDPQAMIVMLECLYGIDYENIWADHIQDPDLLYHARVYVVAEKYQVPKLKEEAYENFESVLGPNPRGSEYGKRPLLGYDFIDFPVAFHEILAGTKPDSKVRSLMMHACTSALDKLKDNPNFYTLLEDHPDLAVEIIKHPNLAGDWECDGKKYTIYGPRECEGVPSCSTCCADKIMRADQEQYEQSFAHRHRNEKEWTCPTCGITAPPECLGCKESIRWVTKKLTRMAIYPPWDNVQDAGRDLF